MPPEVRLMVASKNSLRSTFSWAIGLARGAGGGEFRRLFRSLLRSWSPLPWWERVRVTGSERLEAAGWSLEVGNTVCQSSLHLTGDQTLQRRDRSHDRAVGLPGVSAHASRNR